MDSAKITFTACHTSYHRIWDINYLKYYVVLPKGYRSMFGNMRLASWSVDNSFDLVLSSLATAKPAVGKMQFNAELAHHGGFGWCP